MINKTNGIDVNQYTKRNRKKRRTARTIKLRKGLARELGIKRTNKNFSDDYWQERYERLCRRPEQGV